MIKKKIILQLNSIITTQIISTFCIIFAVLATLCKESGIIVAGAVLLWLHY
jgi:hypothetical protein